MTTCSIGVSPWVFLVVGILLMTLGLVALTFGVGGGITKMIYEIRHAARATADFDPFASLEKVLKAVTELLNALAKADRWLALVVIGFLLVGAGAWMLVDAAASFLGVG